MTEHSSSNGRTMPGHKHIIRLMMANMPVVVGDHLRRSIEEQDDMQLVGQVFGQIEVLAAVTDDIDVLILGASHAHPPPGICSHLLSEFPHLKIVVLAVNGSEAAMYWLGLRHYPMLAMSATGLLQDIRQAHQINAF